jgi:hypothetical protein
MFELLRTLLCLTKAAVQGDSSTSLSRKTAIGVSQHRCKRAEHACAMLPTRNPHNSNVPKRRHGISTCKPQTNIFRVTQNPSHVAYSTPPAQNPGTSPAVAAAARDASTQPVLASTQLQPPVLEQKHYTETWHGRQRRDEYYWLNGLGPSYPQVGSSSSSSSSTSTSSSRSTCAL